MKVVKDKTPHKKGLRQTILKIAFFSDKNGAFNGMLDLFKQGNMRQ